MSVQQLRLFAIDVTESLAAVTAQSANVLPTTKRARVPLRNLGVLAATLMRVEYVLKKAIVCEDDKVLQRYLGDLESICNGASDQGPENALFQSLHAVLTPSIATKNSLQRSLIKFATSGGSNFRNFCANLDSMVSAYEKEAKQVQSRDTEDTYEFSKPIPEYDNSINHTIYDALTCHTTCTCRIPAVKTEPGKRHFTRLRLVDKVQFSEAEDTSKEAMFDVLYSSKPSLGDEMASWQQLRFLVPALKTKSVAFEAGRGSTKDSTTSNRYEAVPTEEFCRLLNENIGYVRIRLKIIGDHFHRLLDPDPEQAKRVAKRPSTSLSDILTEKNMSPKSRLTLAYILAKSVWRYYDSEIMSMHWTTDSIHFMRELRLSIYDEYEEMIDPLTPYYAFPSSAGDHGKLEEYCSLDGVYHRYPRVLALGALLVEVARKKPRTLNTEPVSVAAQLNDDFTEYYDVLESPGWPEAHFRKQLQNEEILGRYRALVRNCFSPMLFQVPAMPGSRQTTAQARSDILYQRVVRPLERLCSDLGIINVSEEVDFVKLNRKETMDQKGHNGHFLENSQQTRLPSSSQEWLGWIMDSRHLDLAKVYRTNQQLRRIRIAILDTGYDPNIQFLDLPSRSKRLQLWEDMAKGIPSAVDEDGHGTHVLSLAMKIAPAADICVVRVAENSAGLGGAGKTIAKAISWAAETAEVDIISISFGFSEQDEDINKAIFRALAVRNERVLFFAAASNNGGNRDEMFPARHRCVYSIRATDHLGSFLSLNPPPREHSDTPAFGTLGNNVPVAGLSSPPSAPAEVLRSGTSFATPIAAGIAAIVLGYARMRAQTDPTWPASSNDVLWTERGMRLVFWELSRSMGGTLRYLSPDTFVHGSDQDRDTILRHAMRRSQ